MQEMTRGRFTPVVLAVLCLPQAMAWAAETTGEQALARAEKEQVMSVVKVTAETVLKQQPGVSTIKAEDIEKQPVANDVSEIVRKMPGVNLTGNTANGQRGNNRQIDLRGMGPENTLILIDGKPVQSRNAVRYGRTGERDTRGDSNWVPAEQIETIEVIRGPAAARYGSGSAGGVVNIVTKGVSKTHTGSVSVYADRPQHDDEEGASRRINLGLSGPLGEQFGYRVFANVNKTDADSPDINVANTVASTTSTAAGREGVRNRDVNGLLRWKPSGDHTLDLNLSYSRQGNIYAGDTGTGASATESTAVTGTNPATFLGQETNVMTRKTVALEHRGRVGDASVRSFIQSEQTLNKRLPEGLVGGTEGNINSADFQTGTLDNYTVHTEQSRYFEWLVPHMLTAGVEWNWQRLDDPGSILAGTTITGVDGLATNAIDRPTSSSLNLGGLFVEDHMEIAGVSVVPGLRLDRHSSFGANWSPSLNLSGKLAGNWTLRGGIARTFKAPNIYQLNPNYVNYSSGNGCNKTGTYTVRCYLLGNEDLKPEISVNKEIGVSWKDDEGFGAGLTYFRNDYSSKIVGGSHLVAIVNVSGADRYVYRWENALDSVVEGLEGYVVAPLGASLDLSVNGTYMHRNDDQYGQPLSIVPRYTVNANLDWRLDPQWMANFNATFYGRQEPRTIIYNTGLATTGDQTNARESYQLFGASLSYRPDTTLRLQVGVKNIFDKRLFREGNSNTAGAATYNEPGRALFVAATKSF